MGLKFPSGWLIKELAYWRLANEIVGGSVLVQLINKFSLIRWLAISLAEDEQPIAGIRLFGWDKQNRIGERLGTLEVPDSNSRAFCWFFICPPAAGMLAQVCGFLNLPRAIVLFQLI